MEPCSSKLGTAFYLCQDAIVKARPGSERREDALSRERIVDAAIELLDDRGENGLTFRALAAQLETGAGAIYWHVANKRELLIAASDAVVARAMSDIGLQATPRRTIRRIAVLVFEAIDAHPWVGAQLSGVPCPTAMLQIFERLGSQIEALGVPRRAHFTSASTLVSYIIGVSVQNAANGRMFEPTVTRASLLETESARWKQLDPDDYPFTRNVAIKLSNHDDRTEFLAGIDLIVAGITALL